MLRVDALYAVRCDLGEGPHWNLATARLTYVDIDAGAVHRVDPATGSSTAISVEPPISFAVPVEGESGWVGGTGLGLTWFGADGAPIGKLEVERARPANRLNDGKADPTGRLWFGSMALDRTPGGAGFYRLDAAGLTTIDRAVTTSNGLDWDVERGRMYYIDSPEQRIDVFSFDVSSGEVEDRRPFATIDPDDGLPDGLTVDADGCVWVALFRGGAVRRYDPDGAIVEDVRLPVTCPTCPVFGGDDLATMFVTTSRHKLTAEQRAEQPLAGALLVVDTGVRGRPSHAVGAAVAALVGQDR
ncbi:MAG: SMP-30/gluconolactonase/LRE family protein [Ilumatobacteraceae bacterium]